MKRILLIVSFLCLFFCITSCAEEPIEVFVNNEQVVFDQDPIWKEGYVFVPIRAISEKMQGKVEWENRTVTVKYDDNIFEMPMWSDYVSNQYEYNYRSCLIDVPACIVKDRTLVPLSVISRIFGCDVQWDESSNSVFINDIETDEKYYDKFKSDKGVPLVYDYEYNNNRCKVPQLNINHPIAESINQRILVEVKEYTDDIFKSEEEGYDSMVANLYYRYWTYRDILSIMYEVNSDAGGLRIVKTINYDLKNNKELSFEDIIFVCGMEKNEYLESMHSKLQNIFLKKYPYLSTGEVDKSNGMYELLEMAGSDECYSETSPIFIEKNGNVAVIVEFPSTAGARSYPHYYDTGLNLKK